jgi:carbamoyltransferase
VLVGVTTTMKLPGDGQASLSALLKKAGLRRARLHRVEHHLAHMASVRDLAGGEPMALLTIDGMGDFVSCAIGRSEGGEIKVLKRVFFPHSLGYFYTAMTQYLGFPHYGDEFKVMGLSSYGKPRYLDPLRELIRTRDDFGFELNLEAFPIEKNPIDFRIEKAQPKIAPFYSPSFLTQIIGVPPRKNRMPLTEAHWDLAKSVQVRFEEVANHVLTQLYDTVGLTTLGLAGGCAHNSVWVGKIPRHTPFRNIHVAPASHDAGIAVGAAILAARTSIQPESGHWALLGPDESMDAAIPSATTRRSFNHEAQLIEWMVREIADGKVVGYFGGRMEFGPRALGSRSILADPRPVTMRERLNSRVKHRESFRPFAASVMAEHQGTWFKDVFDSPTMEAVFEVRDNMREQIRAVVHVDNTCRIQTVSKETQPFYWALLEAFHKVTGLPMLINTSFNDTEPIVASADDALRCFAKTDLDHLVIGNDVYTKAAAKEHRDDREVTAMA